MNNKIIVVTHKDYKIPSDAIYLPIVVGEKIVDLSDKFQPDNEGENISKKNKTYCELTAIYWAWKNLILKDYDYIGVSHYRRYFSSNGKKEITSLDLEGIIKEEVPCIYATPKRKYLKSIEQHYINSRKGYEDIHKKDVERLKRAIHECSPSYDEAALKVLQGKSAHMLNMFIMESKIFNDYCTWLFPIIDRVVELSEDRADQKRYAGALSEFCLDIWAYNNGYKIQELRLLETEKPSLVKKAKNYIKRRV